MKIKKYIYQDVIHIGSKCHGTCVDCSIWRNPVGYKSDIKSLCASKRLFFVFRKKPILNIIGGDPVESFEDLAELLNYLNYFDVDIRVWVPLFCDYKKLHPYLKKIQLWIFIPTSNFEEMWSYTQCINWEEAKKNLSVLISEYPNVGLCHKIMPHNIQTLPELYDYSRSIKKKLLLHYQEKDSFSEESLAFIKRYRWVKGVYLYKSQSAPLGSLPLVDQQLHQHQENPCF